MRKCQSHPIIFRMEVIYTQRTRYVQITPGVVERRKFEPDMQEVIRVQLGRENAIDAPGHQYIPGFRFILH